MLICFIIKKNAEVIQSSIQIVFLILLFMTDVKYLQMYNWGAGEPCPCPENNCVLMKKSSGVYNWVSEKCSEKHYYLCITGMLS